MTRLTSSDSLMRSGEVLTAELDRERVVVLTALALEHEQLDAALELLPR